MNISAIPQGVLDNKRLHIIRRLRVLIGLIKEHDIILDMGCGVGSYITDTLGYLPVGITAIDYDDKSIQYAKNHNHHKNVEYVVASGETYRTDRQFDVIVCSHVLEHSRFPDVLLGNIKKLLKDSGELYLAIPNGHGCFELENFVPRMLTKTRIGDRVVKRFMSKNIKDTLNNENPHVQFFTLNKIRTLLKETGYTIKDYYAEQLIGGVITDRTILRLPYAERINLWLGDRLYKIANGWILICQKN